ncbi:MAG: nitronate monooxygenase [Sulfuricella sp.]|nr:nitronate monooxygenase [Sulfuricella sp.]
MLQIEFPLLKIKGKSLLPIVQGGMGVGISAHKLAGAVAKEGGVGTIASIDLRRHHPDLMEECRIERTKEKMDQANLTALDREIKLAKEIAQGEGMIAVNVMKAVTEHPQLVQQACASGIDAIVMGAGLPLDLPEMGKDYPNVALIPILSDVRGISVILKKWMRKNALPDAIVIEHPRYAGGHLGAPKPEDITDPRFDFPGVLEGVFQLFKELKIESERIPLIPAGGINSYEKVKTLLGLGAGAVQVGTPFAVSEEGDAHPEFKRVLAEARPEDIVTFMSAAGLPARAVLTPWLKNYLKRETKLMSIADAARSSCAAAFDCLLQCGLRDGIPKAGQFCIDSQLAAAMRGDVNKGLFFRGSESLPFGTAIRPVREIIEYLLTGRKPLFA